MKQFDLVVIGAGSGLNVATKAAAAGLKVAIVEEGPMGGTCLNRGCIPSKIVLHSADVAETIDGARRFGIVPKGYSVDFAKVTRRASNAVDEESREIEEGIKDTQNLALFKARARFIGERTVAAGNEMIQGKKIVIAAGTRPAMPSIPGINKVKYMTSDEALRVKKQPKSMIILGGGFIAAEMAHFYGALGTKITIIQRSTMLRNEDKEIADAYTKAAGKKYKLMLGYESKSVSQKGKKITLIIKNQSGAKSISADSLLVATGRVPNSDVLDVAKAGIDVDDRGYIRTNDYLETSAKNVWALGDIAGKYLLKHSANLEAQYVWNSILGDRKMVDYWPMPHAIFSSPQIAAVGYTEEELKEQGADYSGSTYYYRSTGMGLALDEKDGFVKILLAKKSGKILGCHIVGPDAASIIHEVIVAMKAGLTADAVGRTVHIHPALSEVVQRAALKAR
ncbi:MAG: dihydrolipoyl dehydrogenase [Candidatus Aenigmarchaeota archaeon]|nr:dihydrolipoyl dehydrogenase [Candidatus Aenigmarchaeota archaeon]